MYKPSHIESLYTIPLLSGFEIMEYRILSLTGIPYSKEDFSDFILTILGVILPPFLKTDEMALLCIDRYFSPSDADEVYASYYESLLTYLHFIGLKLSPEQGFTYRYYFDKHLNLFIHYEKKGFYDNNMGPSIGRDVIQETIENGDYIDESTYLRFCRNY